MNCSYCKLHLTVLIQANIQITGRNQFLIKIITSLMELYFFSKGIAKKKIASLDDNTIKKQRIYIYFFFF